MKSKNLKEFSFSYFLKFMKLRSIDILLVSAELKQARLCFQLGRMFSPTFFCRHKTAERHCCHSAGIVSRNVRIEKRTDEKRDTVTKKVRKPDCFTNSLH